MKITVVRPTELGTAERSAWSDMQRRSPDFDNPFLSPGFAVAVGRVQPSARVAVIEDERGIAGFFPFEVAGSRVGKPICPRLSDAQALVHRGDFEWGAGDLLKKCDLDVWEFRRLIESQWLGAGRVVDRERQSPVIELDLGYDAYADGHRSTIKKISAQRRRLERDEGPGRFELHSTDLAALQLLRKWKSAQYRRADRWDRMSEPWVVRLLDDLFENPTDGCVAVLSALHTGERTVALHLGLRTGTTLSYWLPAYDPGASRYSPGLALLLATIEAAPPTGIRRIDMGTGDEEYKRRLMTSELYVAEGRFERPSTRALVKRLWQRAMAPARH